MTDPTDYTSEAGAALAYAEAHDPLPDPIDLGFDRILVPQRGQGGQLTWAEHSTRDPELPPLELAPARVRGTQQVYTPTSYVDAVKRYETDQQITYVDQPNQRLVT